MKKDIKYYAFLEGCYLGIILCGLTTTAYFLDSNLLLPKINLYSIIFVVMQLSYSVYVLNKSHALINRDIYDFKYYFSICFLVLSVSLFLSSLYFYFLYNVFNNDLITQYVSFEYSKCIAFSSCNVSIEDFEEIYLNDYFSIYGQFQSYVFSLIPCTLYSAIISLLMKIRRK
mgnify:CR=1 FL=1